MQDPDTLVICSTKAGRFKVYWQGKADGHIMDWNGCNFKYATAEGQPRLGYATWTEADAFRKALEADAVRFKREQRFVNGLTGTSIPDWRFWRNAPLAKDQLVRVGCVVYVKNDAEVGECHGPFVMDEDQSVGAVRVRCENGHSPHIVSSGYVSAIKPEKAVDA